MIKQTRLSVQSSFYTKIILGCHADGGTAHMEEPDAPPTGENWTVSGTDI